MASSTVWHHWTLLAVAVLHSISMRKTCLVLFRILVPFAIHSAPFDAVQEVSRCSMLFNFAAGRGSPTPLTPRLLETRSLQAIHGN